MIRAFARVLAFGLTVAVIAPAAAAQAPAADVSATSRLDRTAVWIGDRVTFTATIICRRETDILMEDVAGDRLKLAGLEVVSTTTARAVQPDGTTTRYELRYVLATYRADTPVLQVAPLSVRYFIRRPGQAIEGAAPAGTVVVPGAAIAFRSVLPEGQVPPPRDVAAPPPRRLPYSLMQPLGLALVVLAFVPFVRMTVDLATRTAGVRRRADAPALSRRQARQQMIAALEALAAEAPKTVEERRAVFARLDALVRRHIADAWGMPVMQATAAEAATLLQVHTDGRPTSIAADVMQACEVALYGPPHAVPAPDTWRETVGRARDVLAAG